MAVKPKKYYVVWHGRKNGIFDTWAECNAQVKGFKGARYKSFLSYAEAKAAFGGSSSSYIGRGRSSSTASSASSRDVGKPIWKSVSVDAACSSATLEMEYQGVETDTGELIFREGPLAEGTNNVGEFLAIVQAARILKEQNSDLPIYSDSKTALAWVRKKKANTTLARTSKNKEIFKRIDQAESWLVNNTIKNRILKWETKAWGEIAADFGRK